jgi:hypothetical protein
MMMRFLTGLFLPISGLRLIATHDSLRRAAWLPFWVGAIGGALAFISLLAAWIFVLPELFAGGQWYVSWAPEMMHGLIQWLAAAVVGLALSLVLMVAFWLLIKLALAPLLSRLAEKTFDSLGVRHPGSERILAMLGVAAARTALIGLISIPFLFLLFFPGLGLLGAFALAVLVSTDILDFGLEAKGLGLGARWRVLRSQVPLLFGMATGQILMSLLPGLALGLLPATVVGASACVARFSQEENRS